MNIGVTGSFSASGIRLALDNSVNGRIASGAGIDFAAGSVTTSGFDFFDVMNNQGGNIGGNAHVAAAINGDYSSGRIESEIDNRSGTIGRVS